MTEFTEELRVSKEILTRVVDVYRKLRNTCRILVANLYDFDPATDMVPVDALDDGRSVRAGALRRSGAADASRLRRVRLLHGLQALNTLATVDLSAFYVDVTKDRMYTLGAIARAALDADGDVSHLRRARAPARADPAGDGGRSVAAHPGRAIGVGAPRGLPDGRRLIDRALLDDVGALLDVREQVNAALEQKRKDKVIGTSLGARGRHRRVGTDRRRCSKRHRGRSADALHHVSDVELTVGDDRTTATRSRRGREGAGGVKCARCWRFVPSVRTEPDWAGICDRCVEALAGLVNC